MDYNEIKTERDFNSHTREGVTELLKDNGRDKKISTHTPVRV